MKATIFTIVSRNYFAYARTLGDSLKRSNPSFEFNILIVDRKDPVFEQQHSDWQINWVEDLGIPNFESVAFKYDILELNTNVKPSFAKRLLERFDKVIYLDPDIYVYASLKPIFDLLERHSVVLTPHITSPVEDDKLPGEQEFLNSGIYNLGFVAFNNSEESMSLLSWWERRCLHLAYNEQAMGLFVDQKWMDFAPSLCATAFVLREQQYNVAYWNLHERSIEWNGGQARVGGQALAFFHFSGLPSDGDDRVSKYQTRFHLTQRPDLVPLFVAYREHLKRNGHVSYLKLPYSFGTFSDGMPISRLARRVTSASVAFQVSDNPFSAGGSIYQVLKSSRLVIPTAQNTTIEALAATRKSAEEATLFKVTAKVFRFLLLVFGPYRYERLMRFVGRISNLRNQSFLLNRKF